MGGKVMAVEAIGFPHPALEEIAVGGFFEIPLGDGKSGLQGKPAFFRGPFPENFDRGKG